jgi:predicted PurR-regulated permease PerM
MLGVIVSIIPLGAWVITMPIGLFLMATGHLWQGLIPILGNILIVGNIDNFLRPRLVSKQASLHPALVLIGLFAGLAQFGFLGVVYGPVFMVVLVTTLEVYREYYAPVEEKAS